MSTYRQEKLRYGTIFKDVTVTSGGIMAPCDRCTKIQLHINSWNCKHIIIFLTQSNRQTFLHRWHNCGWLLSLDLWVIVRLDLDYSIFYRCYYSDNCLMQRQSLVTQSRVMCDKFLLSDFYCKPLYRPMRFCLYFSTVYSNSWMVKIENMGLGQ